MNLLPTYTDASKYHAWAYAHRLYSISEDSIYHYKFSSGDELTKYIVDGSVRRTSR